MLLQHFAVNIYAFISSSTSLRSVNCQLLILQQFNTDNYHSVSVSNITIITQSLSNWPALRPPVIESKSNSIYVNGPALTHTLAYTRRRWCTPAVRRRRCPRHTGGRAGKPDKQIATNCSVSLAYPQHWPPPHRLRIHGATRRWRIHPYRTASSSDSGACKIG